MNHYPKKFALEGRFSGEGNPSNFLILGKRPVVQTPEELSTLKKQSGGFVPDRRLALHDSAVNREGTQIVGLGSEGEVLSYLNSEERCLPSRPSDLLPFENSCFAFMPQGGDILRFSPVKGQSVQRGTVVERFSGKREGPVSTFLLPAAVVKSVVGLDSCVLLTAQEHAGGLFYAGSIPYADLEGGQTSEQVRQCLQESSRFPFQPKGVRRFSNRRFLKRFGGFPCVFPPQVHRSGNELVLSSTATVGLVQCGPAALSVFHFNSSGEMDDTAVFFSNAYMQGTFSNSTAWGIFTESELVYLTLDDSRVEIVDKCPSPEGRIRSAKYAPDGALWVLTEGASGNRQFYRSTEP